MKKIILITMKIVMALILLLELIKGNITNFFACLLTMAIFFLLDYLQNKIKYSTEFRIFAYLFLFSAEILGEVFNFYVRISFFDNVLHFTSGILISILGFYIVKLFYTNLNIKLLTIFIFCFSLSIAAIWEITEFSIDSLFYKDMQKDTIITEITSTVFSKNKKAPITKGISSVRVNNIDFMEQYGGYIDIGLYDTMKDMTMCLLGTLTFLVIKKATSKLLLCK